MLMGLDVHQDEFYRINTLLFNELYCFKCIIYKVNDKSIKINLYIIINIFSYPIGGL